jgi:hypothetical protein
MEIDADVNPAIRLIDYVIDRHERPVLLERLRLAEQRAGAQDEALLCLVVVSAGGWFFARPPVTLAKSALYQLTHPPQAMRMNFLMLGVDWWLPQKRPNLEKCLTPERYDVLMTSAAEIAWEMTAARTGRRRLRFSNPATARNTFGLSKRLSIICGCLAVRVGPRLVRGHVAPKGAPCRDVPNRGWRFIG